jgi:Ca2+-binding EF-hand superfamily protein
VLQKAFKYFDLNNSGSVEPDEFAKAIEKIGIMIPTKQVSQNYFKFANIFNRILMLYSLFMILTRPVL